MATTDICPWCKRYHSLCICNKVEETVWRMNHNPPLHTGIYQEYGDGVLWWRCCNNMAIHKNSRCPDCGQNINRQKQENICKVCGLNYGREFVMCPFCQMEKKPPGHMGWECPRCVTIHAPSVQSCNCKEKDTIPDMIYDSGTFIDMEEGKMILNLDITKIPRRKPVPPPNVILREDQDPSQARRKE